MSRRDTSRGRFYDIAGVAYPSVTSILKYVGEKEALIAWSAKVERDLVIETSAKMFAEMEFGHKDPLRWTVCLQARLGEEKAHKKLLREAADIGSKAHELLEWQMRMELCQKVGPSPILGPQSQFAYAALQKWRESHKVKPVLVEFTVHSTQYGYAGTADLLAEVDGVLTLLDYKTGKKIYRESLMQNAAYRHALREMGLGAAEQGLIVRLPKTEDDPGLEVVNAGDEQANFEAFLHAKSIADYLRTSDVKAENDVDTTVPETAQAEAGNP